MDKAEWEPSRGAQGAGAPVSLRQHTAPKGHEFLTRGPLLVCHTAGIPGLDFLTTPCRSLVVTQPSSHPGRVETPWPERKIKP